MKILVFEYITGGGFCREALPEALAAEGLLMLTALLRDLAALDKSKVVLLLDERINVPVDCINSTVDIVRIGASADVFSVLEQQLVDCDAVWPIAPEIDNILFGLVRLLEKHGKSVLCPSSAMVALTADKLATCQHLAAHGIEVVPTEIFEPDKMLNPAKAWVVKPVDGMGCEQTFRVDSHEAFTSLGSKLLTDKRYIVQPLVEGQAKSLSCLFREGKGWLLCVNTQMMTVVGSQFKLTACRVNEPVVTVRYQSLVDRVARVLPDLWGYVGIDFMETRADLVILEINPRLTTSYAGIRRALGLNVAEQVLAMLDRDPVLCPDVHQLVTVAIAGDGIHAN